MRKAYGRTQVMRRKSSVSKQVMITFVGFLSGYVVASVFDLTQLTQWFNTKVVLKSSRAEEKTAAVAKETLPKPKLEFYTMLTNEHTIPVEPDATVVPAVPTSMPAVEPTTPVETVAKNQTGSAPHSSTPPLPLEMSLPKSKSDEASTSLSKVAANSKNTYFLQVGSFKRQIEAERVKASLLLKGFTVNVVIVNQQNVRWYRVVVGPFASKLLAEQAQSAVARTEHIIGMIRKMDA